MHPKISKGAHGREIAIRPGELDQAKARFGVREVWERLGLQGETPERDGVAFPCPFPDSHVNGDKKPSFNIHSEGKRFKCFGCGIAGGAVDLIAHAQGISANAACAVLVGMARNRSAVMAFAKPAVRMSPSNPAENERPRVRLPMVTKGGDGEREQLAQSRSVSLEAVELALDLDVLRFGKVCGQPCWMLLDESRRAAEARRLDRPEFPVSGCLGARKAHSLKGTSKNWPVGVEVLRRFPGFRSVMLVEGGPDCLAALHFIVATGVLDVFPVSMLGRSTGGRIHPEALALMAGRKVRVYPHADADGRGMEAAKVWGRQLREAC